MIFNIKEKETKYKDSIPTANENIKEFTAQLNGLKERFTKFEEERCE